MRLLSCEVREAFGAGGETLTMHSAEFWPNEDIHHTLSTRASGSQPHHPARLPNHAPITAAK